MLKLARWSTTHRKYVVLGWVALLIGVNALAQSAGTSYSNNFTLPNSDAQRAADLLQRSFPAQAGDRDTIVFKVSLGHRRRPRGAGAHERDVRAGRRRCPTSRSVISPYAGAAAGRSISADGQIAFATVVFDEKANLLPTSAAERVVKVAKAAAAARASRSSSAARRSRRPQQAGFGLSTAVGLLAAIVVLLLTFGSLIAMGLPIVTALFGLGTGLGVIALFTHVVDTPELLLRARGDDRPRRRDRLRAVHPHPLPRGLPHARARPSTNARESVVQAIDTAGRAVLFAGSTVVIALLGMMLLGVNFLYGVAISASIGVLLVMLASLTLLPALLTIAGAKSPRRAARAAPRAAARRAAAESRPAEARRAGGGAWLRWSAFVQRRPTAIALASALLMLAIAAPAIALRLGSSDASNDPADQTTHRAYELLAEGFGQGFNGPLLVVAKVAARGAVTGAVRAVARSPSRARHARASPRWRRRSSTPPGPWPRSPSTRSSSPQAYATTQLVNAPARPASCRRSRSARGMTVYVGGVTAGSVDFATTLGHKLPLFIGVVVLLSALLLLIVFRSLRDPAAGRGDEPALDRRLARRDRRDLPVGLAERACSASSRGRSSRSSR